MHGLAGSAALTLLVLTQIQSVLLGLLYLALFGIGSTVGMLLMSGLIGLPFALSGRRLSESQLRTANRCRRTKHCFRTVVCIRNRGHETDSGEVAGSVSV